MHWSVYEVFAVLSGVLLIGIGLMTPDLKPNEQFWAVLGGVVSAGYGYFVATQETGTFTFPIQIFVIPPVAVIGLLVKAYGSDPKSTTPAPTGAGDGVQAGGAGGDVESNRRPVPLPAVAPRLALPTGVVSGYTGPQTASPPPLWFALVSGADLARSPHPGSVALDVIFDRTSWFPRPSQGDVVVAGYLVDVAGADHPERPASPSGFAFRGTSSMLLTARRLIGVAPSGRCGTDVLDATAGPVLVWALALEDIAPARIVDSATGRRVIEIRRRGASRATMLVGNPRRAAGGQFHPSDLGEFVACLNGTLGAIA